MALSPLDQIETAPGMAGAPDRGVSALPDRGMAVSGDRRRWLPVAVPLAVGAILLGLLFHQEVSAAVQTWVDSTAYSHCFFVLPIAAYLAWDRWDTLAPVPIRPLPWVALLALPAAIVWLGAERIGLMEGRQLVAMAVLELLCFGVLGWRMFRALMAPLLYLFFLVPFGAFLTPVLQNFTAGFIDVGLGALGIPHVVDSFFIQIPEGRFFVAEACAGLRFLIASIAFGVLYACLMYRSTGRRVAFVIASIVVPIIANGFRALGIVVLGHVLGSAQAAAADHLIYGWIFFSFVTLLLILIGLPFRQDGRRPRPQPGPGRGPIAGGTAFAAVVAVCLLAGIGPAASAWLDDRAAMTLASPNLQVNGPMECRADPATHAPGLQTQSYACPFGRITVTVQAFSPLADAGMLVAARRRLSGEDSDDDEAIVGALDVPGITPSRWGLIATETPRRATVSALWVDGTPAAGGLAGRLAIARDSVLGAGNAPVLVAVALDHIPLRRGDIEGMLRGFLQAQPTLSPQITLLSAELARPTR